MTPVAATLGTWTSGNRSITAAYFEAGLVRLDNSLGESSVVSDIEWLDRLDTLKDAGWVKRTAKPEGRE